MFSYLHSMKGNFGHLLLAGILLLISSNSFAQANLLADKNVGVYFSSRAVSYEQEFYLPIAQFVTQDDDAAWNGRLKSEFLIRLGWMLTEQLQTTAEADSVYFMNADMPMGRAMQEGYQPESGDLDRSRKELETLDFVLVLDEFDMDTRIHRSVFIRSNKMVSENIPIKTASFRMRMFDMSNEELVLSKRVCMDDQNTPRPSYWHFDFFRTTSGMGKFLSKVFSTWWELMLSGESSNCAE